MAQTNTPLMNLGFFPAPNYWEAMGLLNSIPIEANRAPVQQMEKLGKKFVVAARAKINNRTHKLERSVGYTVNSKGELQLFAGDNEAYYAAFVEFGHRNAKGGGMTPPHPYFFPAIQEVFGEGGRKEKQEILGDILTRAYMRSRGGGIAFVMAPAQRGMGLAGLLAMSAVGMTAMSALYAGIT